MLPGIIVYLAMWYPRHKMSWRIGLFYCAAPLSGAFGGLLATGLSRISTPGYNHWPFIFFLEGAITVVFGVCCLFFMPHNPGHAKFLTPEEKIVIMSRLKEDQHGAATESDIDAEKFDWHWVRMALVSPNLWFTSIAWFFVLIPLYSFSLFLPTIIRALGYSAIQAQLLTVPPNFAGFLLVLVTTYYSDRIKARGPFMIAGCLTAMIGYAMLLGTKAPATRYGGTFFVACGVFICSPAVMAWLANNTSPHYVRATALGIEVAIANCAAFVATFSYLAKDACVSSHRSRFILADRSQAQLHSWTQYQPGRTRHVHGDRQLRYPVCHMGEQEARTRRARRPSQRGRKETWAPTPQVPIHHLDRMPVCQGDSRVCILCTRVDGRTMAGRTHARHV